jgi:site-specific recombinase XerD
MDLDTLLARFEDEYLDLNDITPRRRIEQLRLLRKFAGTLDRPLIEMTPRDMRLFIGGMIRGGLNPTTGRKYLMMIRSFVRWAYEANLIDQDHKDQLQFVGSPRGGGWKDRPNPYKPDEIAEFYALLRHTLPLMPTHGRGSQMLRTFRRRRHQDLHSGLLRHARRLQFEAQIALAIGAGLRCIEIHRLSMPALHPDNADIVVLTAKQGPGPQVTRAIPYTDHARYWVEQWLDFRYALDVTHDRPWLTLDIYGSLGRQLDPLEMERMARSLERTLHTTRWHWHRFRHTAATEWLRSGVPLEKVRIFMGHATIEQTLAYAEVLNEDIAESFEKAQPLFNERLGLHIPVDEEAA